MSASVVNYLLCCSLLCSLWLTSQAQGTLPGKQVIIRGGTYVPLYGSDSSAVRVESFYLDQYPVTNEEFREFVKKYPQWQKTKVKRLFADEYYLRNWSDDLSLGPNEELVKNSPLVNVSWFAAKAYCECQGKRLPTTDEWEFAALASENKPDASRDDKFYQRSLDWYSKPNAAVLPPVGSSFKNYYSVYGMIGLVWEWVSDFNSSLLIGESRANAGEYDRNLFCGAGSNGVKDVKNYVAFMRYAFRSSLQANYTTSNLGFRCAKSIKK